MKATKEKSADNVQQANSIVSNRAKEFAEYVVRCLDSDDFVDAMNVLLPFDKCVQSKMKMEEASIVKSMGLSLMRMEIDPPLFSLGVNVEIAGREGNEATNSTIFIAACKTIEELRAFVQTEDFVRQTIENLEKQIDTIAF
ncbi:hypothetical protein [uncultured Prevotella sp.]|uniref:hypothetical protein n=1 Tax=uncultured Prevotella sp. TaxID=159272 RepID=UPI00267371DA|nr:hypothetical protein [uncultured Prevotella sp.]